MARGRAALTVIVAAVIAACGASGAPSTVPTPADEVTASPTITASLAATDSPPSTSPPPAPTPVPVPPKPTGVTFDETRAGDEPSSTEITQTVSWGAPRSEGVEIRVYGVTECLAKPANPAPDTTGPCLVEHTPLPESVRTLLATGPASGGEVSWTWTGTFDCEVGLAYDPRGRLTTQLCLLPIARRTTRSLPLQSPAIGGNQVQTTLSADPARPGRAGLFRRHH